MKYDPMMDDSSDDGLPDLEELPALDKASNADFEVDFHSKHLKFISFIQTQNSQPKTESPKAAESLRPGLRKRKSKPKKLSQMKSPREEDEEDENMMALVPIDENDVKADSNDQSYEVNDLDEDMEDDEELKKKDAEISIVHLPGAAKPCQYCNKKFRSLGNLNLFTTSSDMM